MDIKIFFEAVLVFGTGVLVGFFIGRLLFKVGMRKVVCSDGTTRFIPGDPNQIFKLSVEDWRLNFSAALRDLNDVAKIGGDAAISSQAKKMHDDLDKLHGDLMTQFNSAYLGFIANPCDNKALNNYYKIITLIFKKHNDIRKIQIQAGQWRQQPMAPLLQATSNPAKDLEQCVRGLREALDELK